MTNMVDTKGPLERQQEHLDELLDEALRATFPASDPIALSQPRAVARVDRRDTGKAANEDADITAK